MFNKIIVYVLLIACSLLISCDQDGPAEKVGKSLDDATHDTKKSLEDTGEAIDESINDAKRAVEDASD